MASQTIIDQLIVTLGLNPANFNKGVKQTSQTMLGLQQQVQKSTTSMGSNLVSLAGKWLGVASAIVAVKKVVGAIDDAAERTRKLGIDAKNYDTAADRLRNFENAVQMMGGSAEEARRTVAGFQKSIFDLAYNGTMSDSLVMLARLGVQFQDASGQARDFNDVVLDTADAIGKAQENGMSRGNAFQFLQQSGFDAGTAQLILSGRGAIEAEQKRQQQRFQVTPGALQGAEKTATSSIDFDQQKEALLVKGLEVGAGSPQSLIRDALSHPIDTLNKLSSAATDAAESLGKAATSAQDWLYTHDGTGRTRGLINNNPGNLKATGHQARDARGFAVFKTMEEGVRENDRQIRLYEARGLKTVRQWVNKWAPAADKNDVGAYLKDIEQQTGIKPDEDATGSEAAVEGAMFRHESGKGAPSGQDIADLLTAQDDAPVSPTADERHGTIQRGDVHIDNITVNTQAKDAEGIATDIDGSLQRKLMSSQAPTGMQ